MSGREILVCYSCANTWFDSEYMSASVVALLDELHLFSTAMWARILKSFCSVLSQNGEVCSINASVFTPFAQLAHGIWTVFLELHVAETRDGGKHFSMLLSSIFRTLPLGVDSLVALPINLDDLRPYTSHLRARVQNNNATTTHQQLNNNNTTTTRHSNNTTTTATTTATLRSHFGSRSYFKSRFELRS